MQGLMMTYSLTIPAIMRRAEQFFHSKEIVTRLPDRQFHRYTYADFIRRAKQLAVALHQLGVQPGERVATLCWNHYQHLEAYFAVPCSGAVLHTLNLRLSPVDLAYIADHAGDKVVIVDESLLPLLEAFRTNVPTIQHVLVVSTSGNVPAGMLEYEQVLAGALASDFTYPELDENTAAAMCYTSGTTGQPKGVVYSHRSMALHSMAEAMADSFALSENDVIFPIVPMFHANAWGLPFTSAMVGAKLIFPGPFLDPASLLECFERERVTFTGGVPTIWMGILSLLEAHPGKWNLVAGMRMGVGGSAPPEAMIRKFDEHNLRIIHGWGMTETAPLATVSNPSSAVLALSADEQYAYRARQGVPAPYVEIRARGEQGMIPWDGQAMGELEVRGAWIAGSYYKAPEAADRFTEDGWFRTGDIVTIDQNGAIKIQDRSKDLIKSGGEWISSVDLENTLMGHPAVAEAAVIAIADAYWQERPLAVVVRKESQQVTQDELIAFLAPHFTKWWLPDAIEFVEALPHTATGKVLKMALRERFRNYIVAK